MLTLSEDQNDGPNLIDLASNINVTSRNLNILPNDKTLILTDK